MVHHHLKNLKGRKSSRIFSVSADKQTDTETELKTDNKGSPCRAAKKWKNNKSITTVLYAL